MTANMSYPMEHLNLSLNLQEVPRKLFHGANSTGYDAFKRGWISGAQSKFLVIDALPQSSMIGVHFKPGGAGPFLGMPAEELAGQVVELDAVWGGSVWDWRDQLLAAAQEVKRAARLGFVQQRVGQFFRRPAQRQIAVDCKHNA